jgi:hypothetical protein
VQRANKASQMIEVKANAGLAWAGDFVLMSEQMLVLVGIQKLWGHKNQEVRANNRNDLDPHNPAEENDFGAGA